MKELILDDFDPISFTVEELHINMAISQFNGGIFNYILSEDEGKKLYEWLREIYE